MTVAEFQGLRPRDVIERYDGVRRVVIEPARDGIVVVGCTDMGVVYLTEGMCTNGYKVITSVERES